MKTLATQNRKSQSSIIAIMFISVYALLLTSCQKDEMPTLTPQMDQQSNKSEVSRTSGQAYKMIVIDHEAAQTNQQAYTIEIISDGTVTFTGRKNVSTIGVKKFKITAELTAYLKDMFITSNFKDIEDLPYIMDLATVSTSFTPANDISLVTKTDYNNTTPASLIELRSATEKMLNISSLINGKRNTNDLKVNMAQKFN